VWMIGQDWKLACSFKRMHVHMKITPTRTRTHPPTHTHTHTHTHTPHLTYLQLRSHAVKAYTPVLEHLHPRQLSHANQGQGQSQGRPGLGPGARVRVKVRVRVGVRVRVRVGVIPGLASIVACPCVQLRFADFPIYNRGLSRPRSTPIYRSSAYKLATSPRSVCHPPAATARSQRVAASPSAASAAGTQICWSPL